jgi:hypothetical protein
MNPVCPIILIKHMSHNDLWDPGLGCGGVGACAAVVYHGGQMGKKKVMGTVRNKTTVLIIGGAPPIGPWA